MLEKLVNSRKKEVEREKERIPIEVLKEKSESLLPTRDFKRAITHKDINIIAEIKRASPSKGILREEFDIKTITKIYTQEGANAISVIVPNKYFMGNSSYISQVKQHSTLPVLQKDFITEEYQIYKARYDGADAILLIVKIVKELEKFISIANKLGMECLVEVHNQREIEQAISSNANIIGINNRNLETMEVNLEKTFKLRKFIPDDKIVVSESGIKSYEDIKKLKAIGVNAFLIGETLMKSENIGAKLRELLGKE